jgi:8-oxo-dGTP diphosphatase
VVCAIIERDSRFLAALRAPGQSNAGMWEFPGGKVHSGESHEDALFRELIEELSISVATIRKYPSHIHVYPAITIELIPFVCEILSGEPVPAEHAEIQWVDEKEARALVWAAADVQVLEKYLRETS